MLGWISTKMLCNTLLIGLASTLRGSENFNSKPVYSYLPATRTPNLLKKFKS